MNSSPGVAVGLIGLLGDDEGTVGVFFSLSISMNRFYSRKLAHNLR